VARFDLDALSADVVASAASEDPVDQLRAAVVIAETLHGTADELLDRYVSAAREQQRPWSEIGSALGISKQAAQQRFVAGPVDPTAWPKDFDAQARAILPAAQVHARRLRHRYLGTEHLLLALTEDTGLAGATLARLGVGSAQVGEHVLRIVGEGHSGEAATLGISPRTKRVLEAAGQESRRLGHRCAIASPEHVLLALSAQHDAVAAQILRELGATDDRVRQQLAELLEGEAPELARKIPEPRRRRRRVARRRDAA
jgi:Clp amino terminal domain, pathogenicity island component